MKSGVIALLRTKWHSSLLRYDTGTLFFYISVVIKPIPTILYLAQM